MNQYLENISLLLFSFSSSGNFPKMHRSEMAWSILARGGVL